MTFPDTPAQEQLPILVVDDDILFLAWELRALERAGLKVLTAVSFHDAVEVAKRENRIALVSDYALPDGTGLDLARELRKRQADLPVVLVSGSWDPETAQEAMEENCGVIDKIAAYAELLPALRSALNGASPPGA